MTGATEHMMLSIVVPVWGTRHDLPHLLPALQRALDGVEPRSEILVCAVDPSLHDVVEAASATFVESKSSGYGDILRTGIDGIWYSAPPDPGRTMPTIEELATLVAGGGPKVVQGILADEASAQIAKWSA